MGWYKKQGGVQNEMLLIIGGMVIQVCMRARADACEYCVQNDNGI